MPTPFATNGINPVLLLFLFLGTFEGSFLRCIFCRGSLLILGSCGCCFLGLSLALAGVVAAGGEQNGCEKQQNGCKAQYFFHVEKELNS